MENPDFYNDLSLSLAELRCIVEDGVHNRRAAAHHPVVGNIGTDGAPQQRVMILRDFDWRSRQLRFHTDARSDKIQQYATKTETSVLIYDEQAKVQIRLSGNARIDSGLISDQAWSGSTPFARRCYMTEAAPGTISSEPTSGLPDWIAGKQPDEAQLAPARTNFAALLVTIDVIEWLYLANSGHRRAKWQWEDEHQTWSGNWLIP